MCFDVFLVPHLKLPFGHACKHIRVDKVEQVFESEQVLYFLLPCIDIVLVELVYLGCEGIKVHDKFLLATLVIVEVVEGNKRLAASRTDEVGVGIILPIGLSTARFALLMLFKLMLT